MDELEDKMEEMALNKPDKKQYKNIVFVDYNESNRQYIYNCDFTVFQNITYAMEEYPELNYYHVLFGDIYSNAGPFPEYNYFYTRNIEQELKAHTSSVLIKHDLITLPVSSAVCYSLNYKNNFIYTALAYSPKSDITNNDNLYYAVLSILKLWPQEGMLIINTSNMFVYNLSFTQIIKAIEKFYSVKAEPIFLDHFLPGDLYIPHNYKEIDDNQPENEMEESEDQETSLNE